MDKNPKGISPAIFVVALGQKNKKRKSKIVYAIGPVYFLNKKNKNTSHGPSMAIIEAFVFILMIFHLKMRSN